MEDGYENDEDPGFELFEVDEHDFSKVCRHLANEYGYPDKVVKRDPRQNSSKNKSAERKKRNNSDCDNSDVNLEDEKDNYPKEKGYIYLPPSLKHPDNKDDFYPKEFERTIYDCFQ